jgi:hypothetical protein
MASIFLELYTMDDITNWHELFSSTYMKQVIC